MAKAIPQSFPDTVHKLCRWHILKKYKEYLALLYKKYKTFKEEFTAILNWPLMPTEFEDAWAELVHKYNLENDQMISSGVIGRCGFQHITRTFSVLE